MSRPILTLGQFRKATAELDSRATIQIGGPHPHLVITQRHTPSHKTSLTMPAAILQVDESLGEMMANTIREHLKQPGVSGSLTLEEEKRELGQALAALLEDTQHRDHLDCSAHCPVAQARAVLAKHFPEPPVV